MKKISFLLLFALAFSVVFSGCTPQQTEKSTEQSENLKVVCTIFPAYDWAREVLGEEAQHVQLTQLISNGVDMHSYQPTTDDIIRISNCDVFIYVGGPSDSWVKAALAQAQNQKMVVVNLMEVLGDSTKTEEAVEGMQPEEESGDDAPEADEHVWLSLKNAQLFTAAIRDALQKADPGPAAVYSENAAAYMEKLAQLDEEYTKTVSEAPRKTILVCDRFPFRYLADDYGISYFAAFPGCSAETEASFETVAFLAKKADELSLQSVITTESGSQKIAKTVIANTTAKNLRILSLDSMQSVTKEDVQNGVTYLSVMQKNLQVLHEALN